MRWPWFASAAIVIAILIVSLVGFESGAIMGRSVDARLVAAIAAAEQDDSNWRLEDLMAHREQVPDEENSALVMDEVLALLPRGWLAGTEVSSGEQGTRLGHVMEDFKHLEATPENTRLSDVVADSLRGELKTLAEAVKLARTLDGYRRGRHELEIGPTIIDTPLQQTQGSRTVARLLALDAALRAHDGDSDGALDSCRAILGAGRSIGDEPFAISGLVRIAVGAVALKSARRVLGQGEPSDAVLARLQASVLDELAKPLLVIAMRGERAAHTELIRRVAEGEVPISALSGTAKPDKVAIRPSDGPWAKLWFDYQITLWLEWMNKVVSIAHASGRPAACTMEGLASQRRPCAAESIRHLHRDLPALTCSGDRGQWHRAFTLPDRARRDRHSHRGRAPSPQDF